MAAALLLLRALRQGPEPGPRRLWGLLSGRGPGVPSGTASRRPYMVRGTPVGRAPQVTGSGPRVGGGCRGSARTRRAPAPSSSATLLLGLRDGVYRRADVGSPGCEAAFAEGGSCSPCGGGDRGETGCTSVPGGLKLSSSHQLFFFCFEAGFHVAWNSLYSQSSF